MAEVQYQPTPEVHYPVERLLWLLLTGKRKSVETVCGLTKDGLHRQLSQMHIPYQKEFVARWPGKGQTRLREDYKGAWYNITPWHRRKAAHTDLRRIAQWIHAGHFKCPERRVVFMPEEEFRKMQQAYGPGLKTREIKTKLLAVDLVHDDYIGDYAFARTQPFFTGCTWHKTVHRITVDLPLPLPVIIHEATGGQVAMDLAMIVLEFMIDRKKKLPTRKERQEKKAATSSSASINLLDVKGDV